MLEVFYFLSIMDIMLNFYFYLRLGKKKKKRKKGQRHVEFVSAHADDGLCDRFKLCVYKEAINSLRNTPSSLFPLGICISTTLPSGDSNTPIGNLRSTDSDK